MKPRQILCTAMLAVCASTVIAKPLKAPHEVIAQAPEEAWRVVDTNNVIKIQLPTGATYVELNPLLAPRHTNNLKLLARDKFYDGLSFYRFVENFVAQGGDDSGEKPIKYGKRTLKAELTLQSDSPIDIIEVDTNDGYAPRTGFLNSFAVAQSSDGKQTWMVHCTGTLGMSRGDELNSGGTDFYITLTPQRYLDKNTTVFGRVLSGMEHVQRLHRQASETKPFNPIKSVRVLSDISKDDKQRFKVLDTAHPSFKALVAGRKNRPEAWFVAKPNYADVCAIPLPVKAFTVD
ncbi:peptidyl-prolyl cis-trans isomerase [Pseudoalteromonas sp. A25]|uniref:peptidylprolyl isomerase n=1 Tax=Pseudoalteromonas sp. A25 TaxID=116092 RepID=UPI0012608597|nr:peptidylprolyl isomerase [Pseudoalteromonas sp. A25]BBN80973.1 peptidyl-prolyl cis-trans isomerase [Pseudoalteromonas sp. A25]